MWLFTVPLTFYFLQQRTILSCSDLILWIKIFGKKILIWIYLYQISNLIKKYLHPNDIIWNVKTYKMLSTTMDLYMYYKGNKAEKWSRILTSTPRFKVHDALPFFISRKPEMVMMQQCMHPFHVWSDPLSDSVNLIQRCILDRCTLFGCVALRLLIAYSQQFEEILPR